MQRRRLLLGAFVGALGACEPKRVESPPRAPLVLYARDLVPADLDVVVRFDLGRVRATLGAASLAVLARQVLRAAGAEGGDELVVDSLLQAEVVVLAYRPGALLTPLDRVLSLQGHFEQLTRPPPGFAGATDLGADVRYFERSDATALPRGGVARIYTVGTRVRAFVSEAELDAVERVLDTGGLERRLQAPEEGTISLAARPALLGAFAGRGRLRELLDGARALQAVAELASDGLELRLVMVMADAAQAEQLAAAGRAALSSLRSPLAPLAELRAEAARVRVSARLPPGALGPLLACFQAGSESDCPW